MAIADDLIVLEKKLTELIAKYDQYFIGFEKREPVQLQGEVERLVRQYFSTPINNTMYKHKYQTLVARFNTYREYWNRILRLIEDGKYSRDRFISELRQRQKVAGSATNGKGDGRPKSDIELDRLFTEFLQARRDCNMPVESVTREMLAATISKQKPLLAERLGTDEISFRVVVEAGKPKLKASAKRR